MKKASRAKEIHPIVAPKVEKAAVVLMMPEGRFNAFGYDEDGYDREGYDKDGFNAQGYDRDGFDRDGLNKQGLDRYDVMAQDYADTHSRLFGF